MQRAIAGATAAPLVAEMPARSRLSLAQGNRIRRKCACGGTPGPDGECEACRKKRLQRSAAGGPQAGARGGGVAPPVVRQVLQSAGQPIGEQTRARMEERFDYDFSKVRIH